MGQSLIISKVQPSYPATAREAKVQGAVVLKVRVGADGVVQNTEVITGAPALGTAAQDAVKQWRFKPFLMNGRPVEVETQVTINFTLAH